MRTARAKGVSSVKILFKHALRNAILPVITYVGPMLAGLMTGSFVVEKIFSIPGLGRDFVSAITNRDYMMIMGTTIPVSYTHLCWGGNMTPSSAAPTSRRRWICWQKTAVYRWFPA